MNLFYLILGLLFIGLGIFDLIYPLPKRNRLKGFFNNSEIIQEKEEEYLKLQCWVSILGGILSIVLGILIVIYRKDSNIFIVWISILYSLIYFGAKEVSKHKGYIES